MVRITFGTSDLRNRSQNLNKLLVISLAGIGDTLLATPLIRELRRAFPSATIDALVLWPGSKDLLGNNPHLNQVHQKHLLKDGPTSSLPFLTSLRRHRYDVSINTHPQSRIHYRLVARLIGARLRLSHTYECFTPLDQLLVNRVIPQDYEKHTIQQNVDLLPLLGAPIPQQPGGMEVCLTAEEDEWAEDFLVRLSPISGKTMGIHVGSGGTKNLKLKRWPLENYIEVLRKLTQEVPDLHVLLFGGPDERDLHARLQAGVQSRNVREAETRNLRQAAALMRRCDVFLSVDTALMHLAAAMKVQRQIVIEAPTLNKTNLPFGNQFTVVRNPAVGGRNLDYYKYDGRGIQGTAEELVRCMASVTVDSVFEEVLKAFSLKRG